VTRATAYIGLGSNLDHPREQIRVAFDELAGLPDTRLVSRSRLYRSAPVGHPSQPDFVNAVAQLETELAPPDLLDALQRIERGHGRRRPFPGAPRTLDLDLLLYGDAVIDSASLRVPHPRMHERAFVLRPLAEIAPGVSVPGLGTAGQLLHACATQDVEPIA
jgi:2-amino-4-hydroxy-6-hydroxymethyldihydropteridine diphosphokinase